MDTARLQPLNHFAALGIASEKNCSIVPIERMDARIGRARAIPFEPARHLVGDLADAPAQIVLAVSVPILEVDALDFRRHLLIAQRGQYDRKDNLAERARLRELDEAPFGRE